MRGVTSRFGKTGDCGARHPAVRCPDVWVLADTLVNCWTSYVTTTQSERTAARPAVCQCLSARLSRSRR